MAIIFGLEKKYDVDALKSWIFFLINYYVENLRKTQIALW